MDAFFVSVEIREAPHLAKCPVAVGGSRIERGVLSTCNYIARQYGVRSAMPTKQALQLCPDLIVLPGRMSLYKEVSEQLRAIMHRYSHKIEPLSLDEAYLDVSQCSHFSGSATLIAQDILQTIKDELNLTASAGVAPIKFLAKIASDLNKPNGLYVIKPEKIRPFIDTMPLEKIPGVGKRTLEKLHQYGFFVGRDICQSSELELTKNLGKFGDVLWRRCHGIDERNVETSRIRKSVGVERTFIKDLNSMSDLKNILNQQLLPELKIRADKYVHKQGIKKLGVKIKFSDFKQTTKECNFEEINQDIFYNLLEQAWHRGRGKATRLLGIHLGLHEPSNDGKNTKQLSFSW